MGVLLPERPAEFERSRSGLWQPKRCGGRRRRGTPRAAVLRPASLVGSIPAVVHNTSSTHTAVPWGTGQNRTAGNLLVMWFTYTQTASAFPTPAGWTLAASQASTNHWSGIFTMIAQGGDASPSMSGTTTSCYVQLSEFTGVASATADQTGGFTGTTSPQTATFGGPDTYPGSLILFCGSNLYTAAAIGTNNISLNNGASPNGNNNNSTSSAEHYNLGYGVTTDNAAADTVSLSFTTTNISHLAYVAASFRPIAYGPSLVVSQAVQRAAVR